MKTPQSRLDRAFYITLYLKAADGIVQLIGGILLLFLKHNQIDSTVRFLGNHSYGGDIDDALFRHASHYLSHLTGSTIRFAAIYLIADALIKLVLINEVLHKRYWAYIGLIIVLSGLVLFQTYRIILYHSPLLIGLTLFDILIIYLSAKEYSRHMHHRPDQERTHKNNQTED